MFQYLGLRPGLNFRFGPGPSWVQCRAEFYVDSRTAKQTAPHMMLGRRGAEGLVVMKLRSAIVIGMADRKEHRISFGSVAKEVGAVADSLFEASF